MTNAEQALLDEYSAPAPAVSYAALTPVGKYISPTSAVTYAVQAPVDEHSAQAPVVSHAALALVVEYIAPAPAETYAAPAGDRRCGKNAQHLRTVMKSSTIMKRQLDLATRLMLEQISRLSDVDFEQSAMLQLFLDCVDRATVPSTALVSFHESNPCISTITKH